MCHVSVAIDQSVHPVQPVFDAVAASAFYIRSVRMVPVAWSPRTEVHFSLGGGSTDDLSRLLGRLETLPAVLSTTHVPPPAWREAGHS
jgi:hypothetical protein